MKTADVSFGRVVAIYGKQNKVEKINRRLQYRADHGQVVMKDVTNRYKTAPSDGLLAKSAQNGDKIEIYITGDDIKNLNNDPGWRTLDGILSNISAFYDAAKVTVGEAVEKIMRG